jgi:hypothetical protein
MRPDNDQGVLMAGLSPEFSSSTGSDDIDRLISFIRQSEDLAAIDAALLAASDNPPFYPDDRKLTGFFIAAKSDPALDAKLLQAAALSAPAREQALLESRAADKQGAFTNFIYADPDDPQESKIYKVIRAPQIGSGNGAWGGLKEGEDVDVSVTVNREVYEEVIDAVKLLLKTGGGAEGPALEKAFDASLKAAFDNRQPPSAGVTNFIAGLGADPALQARVAAFAALANDLIDDLVAADKQKLFSNRDDAHAIGRGWGFRVDAFAHVAGISKATAEKFDRLQGEVETLKKEAVAQGLTGVAGEMQGIAIYTLAEAPQQVAKNHYGHEGLAEITGFARLLKSQDPAFDTGALWQKFSGSGAIDALAKKMRLKPEHMKEVYDKLAGESGAGSYLVISDAAYRAAGRKPVSAPKQRL